VSLEGVVVARRANGSTSLRGGGDAATWNGGEVGSMAETGEREFLEDRQRVDRWLEEGQYLLGRIIPALLDDRERLQTKLETAEQECERLRLEVAELRKDIVRLQGQYRSEQVAIAEAFGGVMDLLGQLHKPLSDINRRLQPIQFAAANESPS
jgi:chromosome segregation ATPase